MQEYNMKKTYATIREKAMKNMKEAEKRWKQTSMSAADAIEKYGKENVKVKKGALRNGDDMVEVFVESMNEGMDPASPELAKIFDNLKRGDKVKIKHDSALEKGTDYIEYVVRSNNVLRNGVEKATLARADSPTSVKRILYKRNGKVSMAIGDMAATLVDIQVDEGYYKMPDIDRERYTEMPGLEGPFQTRSGKVVYYDPKEGAYYDRDTDMYMTYDEFKALDEGHSPHKKGTKKYKAHMAAMHANSVDVNSMRNALDLKEGNDSDVVAGYVRTMLNEKHDTWNKVTNEIDFVLGLLKEHNADRQTVFNKLYTMNYKDNLDNNIVIKENIDTLRDIVNNKSVMTVKFQDGTMKVDMTTASIFLQAFDKMREDNQAKVAEMMKTKKGFLRVMDIIYGAMK